MSTIRLPNHKDMGVAEDQFCRPIGTWRLACVHLHQHSTQYRFVLFRPSWARRGYRATSTIPAILRRYSPNQTQLNPFQQITEQEPMARAKPPATVSKTTPMSEVVEQEEMTAANQLAAITRDTEANVVALAQELKYDGALSVGALEDGIRFYQQRTAEACLQLGVRLILLKEACAHGDFMPRLELLGIDHTAAKRFMAVSAKFSKGAAPHLLKAANSQSKLVEMLVLDDREAEEFAETGAVRGMTADAIEKMGYRELRTKLREAEADKVATDKLLAEKNAKIDKLSRRIEKATPDDVLEEMHKETITFKLDALGCIRGQINKAFTELSAHHEKHGGDGSLFMAGVLGELQAEISALREKFALSDTSTAADQELAREVDQWAK